MLLFLISGSISLITGFFEPSLAPPHSMYVLFRLLSLISRGLARSHSRFFACLFYLSAVLFHVLLQLNSVLKTLYQIRYRLLREYTLLFVGRTIEMSFGLKETPGKRGLSKNRSKMVLKSSPGLSRDYPPPPPESVCTREDCNQIMSESVKFK